MKTPKPGTITWCDLTVPNADAVRDFYGAVAGWSAMAVDMGGYHDYAMIPPGTKQAAGGICHARGENAGLPAQWLVYINVPDLAASLQACTANGGTILHERPMGGAKMAIIRDPSGAVAGLFQPELPKKPARKKAVKKKSAGQRKAKRPRR